jgi:hypothetical protein
VAAVCVEALSNPAAVGVTLEVVSLQPKAAPAAAAAPAAPAATPAAAVQPLKAQLEKFFVGLHKDNTA